MALTEEYTGYETEAQEGYLQPDRYKISYRCLRCNHEYSRIARSLSVKNVPCPKKECKEAALEAEIQRRVHNFTEMVESGQGPGITGRNTMVKAVDATATQVMEDYHLTNLRDDIRQGESMVPKLPGKMQEAADSYFKPGTMGMGSRQRARLGQRALAGAYRNMAVAPTDVFPGKKGESALHHVRTEKIGG